MKALYLKAVELDYWKMHEKKYQEWLQSVYKEKNKYTNKKLVNALQGK